MSKLLNRTVVDIENEFNAPDPRNTSLEFMRCLLACHAVYGMECALGSASVCAKWLSYYEKSLDIRNLCCDSIEGMVELPVRGDSVVARKMTAVPHCQCMHSVAE